jgi:GAF domain-containing protein
VQEIGLSLLDATSNRLDALVTAEQGSPRSNPLFERFPEVLQVRPAVLAAVPVRGEEPHLLGVVVLSHAETEFAPEQLDAATKITRLVAAVLERDDLRRKLEERKIIERAKGMIQSAAASPKSMRTCSCATQADAGDACQ